MTHNPKFESKVRETWPDKADLILAIIRNEAEPEDIKGVTEELKDLHNRPDRKALKLMALNHVLLGHGIECVPPSPGWAGPDMEYVNNGDTYAPTIVLDHTMNKWMVTSWGDRVEHAEDAGRHYE